MSSTDSGECMHLPADDEPPSPVASCPSASPLLTILTHPAAGHETNGHHSHDRSNGLPQQHGPFFNGPYFNGSSQLSGPLEGHPLREASGYGNGHDVAEDRAKPNGRHRLNGNGRLSGALRPRFSTDDLASPARKPASTPQTRLFRRRF